MHFLKQYITYQIKPVETKSPNEPITTEDRENLIALTPPSLCTANPEASLPSGHATDLWYPITLMRLTLFQSIEKEGEFSLQFSLSNTTILFQ